MSLTPNLEHLADGLPLWKEVQELYQDEVKLTALQQFVHEYEPTHGAPHWRAAVAKLAREHVNPEHAMLLEYYQATQEFGAVLAVAEVDAVRKCEVMKRVIAAQVVLREHFKTPDAVGVPLVKDTL